MFLQVLFDAAGGVTITAMCWIWCGAKLKMVEQMEQLRVIIRDNHTNQPSKYTLPIIIHLLRNIYV